MDAADAAVADPVAARVAVDVAPELGPGSATAAVLAEATAIALAADAVVAAELEAAAVAAAASTRDAVQSAALTVASAAESARVDREVAVCAVAARVAADAAKTAEQVQKRADEVADRAEAAAVGATRHPGSSAAAARRTEQAAAASAAQVRETANAAEVVSRAVAAAAVAAADAARALAELAARQVEHTAEAVQGVADARARAVDTATAAAVRAAALAALRRADDVRSVTAQLAEVLGHTPGGGHRDAPVDAAVTRDALASEHQADLALRNTDARMRAAIAQVVDYAIVGLSPNGIIESWNTGAERLKGYTESQAIGRNFAMLYTAQDSQIGLPARLLDAARAEGRVEHQGWRVHADGSAFWANVVITALHDAGGTLTGFVNIARDLTTQHRLKKTQDSLFATISHDLKTPLTAIKMYAEVMGDVDPDTQADYAHRIGSRADHLAELVDSLFDYARFRTEPVSVSLQPLVLSQLAKSCAHDLSAVLGQHPIEIDDSDLVALADLAAMTRILGNLLSNAARYSPADSAITITFDRSEHAVRLRVTDRGRGIAPEDLEAVFTEFNRGRLAEHDGGTGLGLASVRQLTTLQGGRTWIESRLAHGTSVTVELAAAPAADPVLAAS